MDRIQEQLWAVGAQKGDEKAFESLVTRYERQLLYYLTHFTKDPWQSADALQDVWVTVFRGLQRAPRSRGFRLWLYLVAHNRVMTLLRRKSIETEAKQALQDEQNVPESQNEAEFADAELIHRALAQPEYQIVRSDGTGFGKDEYLTTLPKQAARSQFRDIVATAHEDMMVIRYVIVTDQTIEGQAVEAVSPRLSVFRKDGDTWLIASHASFAKLG